MEMMLKNLARARFSVHLRMTIILHPEVFFLDKMESHDVIFSFLESLFGSSSRIVQLLVNP